MVEGSDKRQQAAGIVGRRCDSRDGQAMVEFVVAMIVVVVLFASLIQLGLLGAAQTDLMRRARHEAGLFAISSAQGSSVPAYTFGWLSGDDDVKYSADDRRLYGDINDFEQRLVGCARPEDLHDEVGDNMVSLVADYPEELLMSFERGYASEEIPLLPVIRNLVYGADSIELECEVWLPVTGDIY